MGNLRSVVKVLQYLGLDPRVTGEARDLERSAAVVVPGVGALPDAMARLEGAGMADAIRELARAGRPLLGICLGMQVLYEYGDEGRGAPGLGLLPGRVRRFPSGPWKVPHMGWNTVGWDAPMRLFAGLPSPTHFYFVHSYYAAVPEGPAVPGEAPAPPAGAGAGADGPLVARCEYAVPFAAAVERGNVMGTQFHPEKSGRAGLRLLANFARLVSGDGGG